MFPRLQRTNYGYEKTMFDSEGTEGRKEKESRGKSCRRIEINRMKIEMEREQHKATLDAQMAQITASTQANMKMIEFLTSMMGKLQNEGSK